MQQGHAPLPTVEGGAVQTHDDFEPKWFAQLPDPVYQLMHPAKCCWCMCAIPAGAICVTFLALASAILSGVSVPLAYGGAMLLDEIADMPVNGSQPWAPSPATRAGPAALGGALWGGSSGPAHLSAFVPGALGYGLWAAGPGGRVGGDDDPFSGATGGSGSEEAGVPSLPSGARPGTAQFAREMHATADFMRLSAGVQAVEALLLLAVAAAALPGLLCDGAPLLLRQSAEGRFLVVQLRIVATVGLALASPNFTPGTLFSTGVGALITFVLGVHFAGVVYQAARMKHYEVTRGAAPHLGGGEAVPPPAAGGTFANLGPGAAHVPAQGGLQPGGVAPGVRVHTSGVVQSGV